MDWAIDTMDIAQELILEVISIINWIGDMNMPSECGRCGRMTLPNNLIHIYMFIYVRILGLDLLYFLLIVGVLV